MLNCEQTYYYIKQAKNGDEKAKECLLLNNTLLLKSIIKRFYKKGVEYDDLYQLACLGFIKAIYNFDEKFGVVFSTYAVPMIIGEIKRFLRDDGSVKVSRLIKSLGYKINQYTQSLQKEGAESPSVEELSVKFDVEKEDIVLALSSQKPIVSLFETVNDDSDKPVELIDKLPAKESEDELIDNIMLKQIIEDLPERERKIIIMRYYKDKTQSEIAKELGVSQVQVSRLESNTLKKLKMKM